jgi:antitoxin FitA
MVVLQIRDVPDDVRRALAEQARAQGQSLQAFLLSLVRAEARRSANLALLDRFTARTDGSRLPASEATDVLDAARDDRQSRLTGGRN